MQLQERLIAYLRAEGVPFSVHDAGGISVKQITPVQSRADRHLVHVNLAFVDGRLSQFVYRADQAIDLTYLATAFGWASFEIACLSELQPAFPDLDIQYMPPLGRIWQMSVFVDRAVDSQKALQFYAGHPRVLIEVPIADFYRLTNPTISTFATEPPERDRTSRIEAVDWWNGLADYKARRAVECGCGYGHRLPEQRKELLRGRGA